METQVTVVISAESIAYLEHDTREPLISGGKTRRASWVLPSNAAKRVAFRVLRFFAGDHGKVADWCRSWQGGWIVDLSPVGGPLVTGFSSRSAALQYEHGYVMRRLES